MAREGNEAGTYFDAEALTTHGEGCTVTPDPGNWSIDVA